MINSFYLTFQALANIVYEMNVDKVSLVTEDERATVQFLTEATYLNIRYVKSNTILNNSWVFNFIPFTLG